MIYDKGDVIEKRGIIFKDNKFPDPKEKRPAMIMLAVSENHEYMYYLTLTSQTYIYFEKPDSQDMYFLLKKTPYNMLKQSSLVNLQNIYRESVLNYRPVAFIQEYEYRKLIRKFQTWQEKTDQQDEYYQEIKELL